VASTELKRVIPILDVRDVNAALRYYVEHLGFQVDFRYEGDPNNYAGVSRGNVWLHMQWQDESEFTKGRAGNLRIRIAVDDPEALFEEFKARGAFDNTVQVRDTDWRTREFGFRDPDGNSLAFYRPL
jgi:uncharacterized glyoxalase superfamily protein PhnB